MMLKPLPVEGPELCSRLALEYDSALGLGHPHRLTSPTRSRGSDSTTTAATGERHHEDPLSEIGPTTPSRVVIGSHSEHRASVMLLPVPLKVHLGFASSLVAVWTQSGRWALGPDVLRAHARTAARTVS